MIWLMLFFVLMLAIYTWWHVLDIANAWAKTQNDDSYHYHTSLSKQHEDIILTQKDKIITDFNADDSELTLKQRWIRHAISLWAVFGILVMYCIYGFIYMAIASVLDFLPQL